MTQNNGSRPLNEAQIRLAHETAARNMKYEELLSTIRYMINLDQIKDPYVIELVKNINNFGRRITRGQKENGGKK